MVAAVANSLLALEPLARTGALVVLAHPLDWNAEAAKTIRTVALTERLTPGLAGMCATLGAAAALGMNSYTIPTDKEFQRLRRSHLNSGRPNDRMLLSGVLARRLLSDKQLAFLVNLPLAEFQHVIENDRDFYRQLHDRLSSESLHEAEYRIRTYSSELAHLIHSRM